MTDGHIRTPSRLMVTLILLPLLYLSGVRFVTQLMVTTDKSTLFNTALGTVLSIPQSFSLNRPFDPVNSSSDANYGLETHDLRLKTISAFDFSNADIHFLFAQALLLSSDLNAAGDASRVAISLSPVDPKNWLLLGWIEGLKTETTRGCADFDRAVMVDPNRADSLAQQGAYYYQLWLLTQGEEKKAFYNTMSLMNFRSALELKSELYGAPDLTLALATLYKDLGQPGYAVTTLGRIPEKATFTWPMLIQRAALLFEINEGVKALSLWKKQFVPANLSSSDLSAIEKELRQNRTVELAYFLAQIYMVQGKYEQALKELIYLVERKGSTAEYKVALASVQEQMGNTKEAARLYEEVLRLSPANQEAKRKMTEYYAKGQKQ